MYTRRPYATPRFTMQTPSLTPVYTMLGMVCSATSLTIQSKAYVILAFCGKTSFLTCPTHA